MRIIDIMFYMSAYLVGTAISHYNRDRIDTQDGAPTPRSHPPPHSQLTAFLSDRLKMVRYFALAARGGQPRPRSRDSPAAPSTADFSRRRRVYNSAGGLQAAL